MKQLRPLLAAGGDLAEKKFMECCWCLWKANGAELVEPSYRRRIQRLAGEITFRPFSADANHRVYRAGTRDQKGD